MAQAPPPTVESWQPVTALPRRTCPACARRYAGLIAPDCVVCDGLGVLTLGAPALAHHPAPAVARAAELYLEAQAQHANATRPYPERRGALEASVAELRVAGVLHRPEEPARAPASSATPEHPTTVAVVELAAHRLTRATTGAAVQPSTLNALRARPVVHLSHGRPRDGRFPTASANGDRSALATIADPIDPLGPDTHVLEADRRSSAHEGRVIATAVPDTVRRRTRRNREA